MRDSSPLVRTSMTDQDGPVFVGQKAFIEKNGKVLVLRDPHYMRNGQKGLDFPGGRFRYGNGPEEELKREVSEETSLKIVVGRPFTIWTNYGHSRHNKFEIYLIGFICKYKSGNVILSQEHNLFEWVDKKTYKKWRENTPYFKALEDYFKFKDS